MDNYYNQYLQGNNPYQQPVQYQQWYPQPAPVPPQPPKKTNKIALIIGISAGVIILILAVTIAVIALNSGNGDTYNTYNSYYSVEYTQINDGLKNNEKEFYENGKIPEEKIPILFEKQEAYLKEQKDNGIIRDYTVSDDSIYIEFNPDDDGNCPDPIEYIPGMYYSEYEETSEPVTEATTVTTTEKKTPDWTNAAVELIYNFPKYGFETVDTTTAIEIIDLNDDDVPEIVYANCWRANPLCGGFYYFNGEKYVKADYDSSSEEGMFPIYPVKDSLGDLMYISDNFPKSKSEAKSSLDMIAEGGASYYLAYASYSSSYKFSDNRVSVEVIYDLRDYVNETYDGGNEPVQNYLEGLDDFRKQYVTDEEKNYLIAQPIYTGMLNTDGSSSSGVLSQYHKVVTKSVAQSLVSDYKSGLHSVEIGDESDIY